MQKDVIGIVGGMGPDAGIALSKNLISQTIAEKDQEHLPQVLFSIPELISDRTEYILGEVKTNPAYSIAKILLMMESIGVRLAAMACNSAHAPQIFNVILSELNENYSGIKLLHMIKEVGLFIRDHYEVSKKVGIMGTTGTYYTRQYDLINESGLSTVYLTEPEQKNLHSAIYHPLFGIKANAGRIPAETVKILEESITSLIKKGAEIIVLGCTELPLLFSGSSYNGIPVVDSSLVMARALIKAHSPEKLKPWQV